MAPWIYVLIPADPAFLPAEEQERLALAEISRLLPAATPEPWRSDNTRVVGLFRPIQPYQCPRCGKPAKMSRSETFSFGEMLSVESASDISFEMPCCGADSTLAELRCAPNLGFARFGIDLACLRRAPAVAALAAVGEALGSPVLLIRTPVED